MQALFLSVPWNSSGLEHGNVLGSLELAIMLTVSVVGSNPFLDIHHRTIAWLRLMWLESVHKLWTANFLLSFCLILIKVDFKNKVVLFI